MDAALVRLGKVSATKRGKKFLVLEHGFDPTNGKKNHERKRKGGLHKKKPPPEERGLIIAKLKGYLQKRASYR